MHTWCCCRYYMTGGNKMGARAAADSRAGAGPGIAGFDPTSGADPIFAAAGRAEEQHQAQQATSQVCSDLLTSFKPKQELQGVVT